MTISCFLIISLLYILASSTSYSIGGRNVDEAIRVLKAFQFVEKNGEVCPANWAEGGDTMVPDPEGSKAYFEKANN